MNEPGGARRGGAIRKAIVAGAVACSLGLAFLLPRFAGPPPAAQVWVLTAPQQRIHSVTNPEAGPYTPAHAAILMENSTGTILYGKDMHEPRAPASTTKIMTAIVALEHGKLEERVLVSRKAAATPGSTAYLVTGQSIRMIDLLHGLLMRSGNDAAVAVAEHVAGSEEAFVKIMNERAGELGALATTFKNPHGLDEPGHLSTAYDLAILSRAALLYPTFAEIVQKTRYAWSGGVWHNTNRLLERIDGAVGIKTGTTGKAGYCLVSAAKRDGMELIGVVLGSADRWGDSARLLEYGFADFHRIALAQQGDPLAHLAIPGSRRSAVAVAAQPLAVVLRDEEIATLTTRLHVERLRAPIRRGQRLGTYEVRAGERAIAQIPLVALQDVPPQGWLHRLFWSVWGW